MILYNIGIYLYSSLIGIASCWNQKARLFKDGRRGLIDKLRSSINKEDRIFWLHAASLGEFEQGRPILEYVKANHPEYKILLTFFSPSGYEIRKNYKGADFVTYLPEDKPSFVSGFFDAVHPDVAVIVKYEYWLNYLSELRIRHIPTYIVSAIFDNESIFFKPYGSIWRDALKTFNTIFVQNDESARLLGTIVENEVVVAGDTRFDRAVKIAEGTSDIALVQDFCEGKKVLVAGSTWGPDEAILIPLMNSNPDIRFIIAPHEMDEERISRLVENTRGGAVRFTKTKVIPGNCQLLIIDTIGLLATVYRYATYAYIGGGFGVGIHNTVEPTVYGLPLAFGPNYHKFREAVEMVKLGIACPVENYKALSGWLDSLNNDEQERRKICERARKYTRSQTGATDKIMSIINL